MRNIKWWFLFSLSSVVIVCVAAIAVWIALQKPYRSAIQVPENADVRTYAEMALVLARQEHFAEALVINQKALKLAPDHPILHYNQGWLAAKEGRWKLALQHFDQGHVLKPEDVDTLYNRAWVHQQMGDQLKKDADLKLAMQFQDTSESASEQVRTLQLLGKDQQALDVLEKLSPEQLPDFYYLRSRSNLALKKYEAALADVDQVLKPSNNPERLHERSLIYLALGQKEAALADLNQVLEMTPNDEYLLEKLQIQSELNPALTLTELKPLLERRPEWLSAHYLGIQVQMALKDTKTAQTAIEQALKADSEDATLWFFQAQLFRQRRRYTEAQEALQRAEKNGYSQALLWAEKARLASQQNLPDAAKSYMKQAIVASPELKTEFEQDRLLKRWL